MIEYNELYNQTKNLKVLYIEDDKNFQIETNTVLEYFFTHIDLAIDGEDGLKQYIDFHNKHNQYYDIVITDINMPNKNGIELVRDIYNINTEQLIIVISAHDESHYLLELINMGIEQFLQKPIVYDQLTELLDNISKKIIKQKVEPQADTNIIKLDENYYWDTEQLHLVKDGDIVKLTKKETLLMQLFIKNNTKISTIEEIYSFVWEGEEHLASMDSLMPIISRFRKKLPENIIENVSKMGYRLKY